MTDTIKILLDCAYALGCCAGALVWPPLALVFATGYLLAQAVLLDRRTAPAEVR
jgi:hypothetical protein